MDAGIASRAAIDGEERIRAEVVSLGRSALPVNGPRPCIGVRLRSSRVLCFGGHLRPLGLEYAAAAGFKQHPKPSGPTPPLEAFEQQWQVAGVGRAKLAPARCLSEGSIKMDM